MLDAFMLKKRPDQTVYTLNEIIAKLERMNHSIAVVSKDKKSVVIIGEQPIDRATGKPYSFGIHQYRIKGDILEEI